MFGFHLHLAVLIKWPTCRIPAEHTIYMMLIFYDVPKVLFRSGMKCKLHTYMVHECTHSGHFIPRMERHAIGRNMCTNYLAELFTLRDIL